VTIDGVLEAVGQLASYTYSGDGIAEVPALGGRPGGVRRTVRQPTRFVGAYQAPDRGQREWSVTYRDQQTEAETRIGDTSWVRYLGTLRWTAGPLTAELDPVRAALEERSMTWTEPQPDDINGYCTLDGTGIHGDAPRTVTVAVDPDSRLPVHLRDGWRRPDGGGWIAGLTEDFRIAWDADVSITPPVEDRQPASAAEALYALERKQVADASLVYTVRDGALDGFGFENATGYGHIWFFEGMLNSIYQAPGDMPPIDVFTFTTGDPGSPAWYGGPMKNSDVTTLRITFADEVREFAVAPPAYIVRASTVEPDVRSWRFLSASDELIFSYP
jgi:hypothetical protein